jgi:hypothetical protein
MAGARRAEVDAERLRAGAIAGRRAACRRGLPFRHEARASKVVYSLLTTSEMAMNYWYSILSSRSSVLRHRWLPPARLGLALGCLALAGCAGDGEDGSGGGTTTTTECALGDVRLEDGRCQPPGLPLDMPCEPGETPLEDGSCQAAGVPPELCGDGFEADGDGGCKPILPEEPCPSGLMVIPGETECHEANTQFVNGSYAGNDSDGTQAKPWKTINEGVAAAAKDAIVAIAAGTYQEDVVISFKAKRLWGRCPSMVTIEGVEPQSAALVGVATGSEVHGIAFTGPYLGVYVSGPDDFLLENVWIHDTGVVGAVVDKSSSATVRGSLIERTGVTGLVSQGGTLTIERSAVRDPLPVPSGPDQGLFGRGVEGLPYGGLRANVTVTSSLFERTGDVAVRANESDITLDGVAVRQTTPVDGVAGSPGIGFEADFSHVTIRGSTFEQFYGNGIIIGGSEATLERVTVTDGSKLPNGDGKIGGILVQSVEGTPSKATVRMSAVANQSGPGISVVQSSALIESTLVRDAMQALVFKGGAIALHETTETTVRYTVIADSQFVGLGVVGGAASFEASVVRDMRLEAGLGACVVAGSIGAPGPTTLTVRSSLLDQCAAVGAFVYEANLVMETSLVRDVLPDVNGKVGDGVMVLNEAAQTGSASLMGVRIEGAYRAGASAFGGRIDAGDTSISCAKYGFVGEKSGPFDFTFNLVADNACGCPETTDVCQVESPGLQSLDPQ